MRRPRAKTLRLAALTAASAAITAACGVSNAATTGGLAAGPSGTPITVGISEPLSGPAQAQGFAGDGQACLRGYQLWASEVNSHGGLLGHPVKLVVMNDQGWPASTKYDYHWLITHDHVNLVLGPFSSLLTANGAVPATQALGYALAAGSAGGNLVYIQHDPDLFATNIPVSVQMQPFAKWVLTLHGSARPTSAAYPTVANPFSGPPVVTALNILSTHGVATAYRDPEPLANDGAAYGFNLPASASAAATVLRNEARKVVASHAQMVVIGSVDVPTVQAFIKYFVAHSYHPKLIIAAAGPDQGNLFLHAVGTSNAIGVMVPNSWFGGFQNALSHVMVQEYIAKYGGTAGDINADVAESYSAAETLQAAVQATGGTVQSKIIHWLHTNQVQTVLGPVAFNSDGENTDALHNEATIFQWQLGAGGTGANFVQVLPSTKAGSVNPVPWAG
jgi:branched-chain amino acid transport system substrate-binding protein